MFTAEMPELMAHSQRFLSGNETKVVFIFFFGVLHIFQMSYKELHKVLFYSRKIYTKCA